MLMNSARVYNASIAHVYNASYYKLYHLLTQQHAIIIAAVMTML